MKIHEYQGKQIFAKYGIPVPKGIPAFTADEAEQAAKKLIDETETPVVVVKAQIHAGGRGKGGGVKVVKDGAAAARAVAEKMLGSQLVTHQTGPEGQKVRRLYIEQGLDIASRAVPGLGRRPGAAAHRRDGLHRGRRRDRKSRRGNAREDPHRAHRSASLAGCLPGAEARVRPGHH